MSVPERIKPKALIGASIPRSGHHYLQRTLSRYFEGEIYYCEWYTPPDCCKQVPCTRGSDCRVTYQKSHDWDFSLDQNVSDALYLVQFRHPVPEALSDRDLAMRDSIDKPNRNYRLTKECYGWWLATKAIYYRKFHDKWFRNRVHNSVYLNYDDLLRDPAATVEPILRWVSGNVDEERLTSAIAQASASRGGKSAAAFSPRVIESSRHFDRDLLSAFEAYVLDRCPQFGFKSEFSASYENHEIYGLILAQDPDEPLPPGEHDRLGAAARYAPDHPEIVLRLAKRELDREAPDRAIALLEAALARNPFFASGYRLLAHACRTIDQPLPSAFAGAAALLACTKYPDVLVEIAEAMLEAERSVDAIAALSVATVFHPDYHRANYLLAKILAKEGRWAQARQYADRASELEPNNKKNGRLRAKIAKHIAKAAA
jgi:hypothetical protein